ncbi:hypothetical protein PALS2_032 [Staphylococcus phage PALS_2]|nr:hypothetical protein PALS2_032 [Staphylococcus phage PALS_2]
MENYKNNLKDILKMEYEVSLSEIIKILGRDSLPLIESIKESKDLHLLFNAIDYNKISNDMITEVVKEIVKNNIYDDEKLIQLLSKISSDRCDFLENNFEFVIKVINDIDKNKFKMFGTKVLHAINQLDLDSKNVDLIIENYPDIFDLMTDCMTNYSSGFKIKDEKFLSVVMKKCEENNSYTYIEMILILINADLKILELLIKENFIQNIVEFINSTNDEMLILVKYNKLAKIILLVDKYYNIRNDIVQNSKSILTQNTFK